MNTDLIFIPKNEKEAQGNEHRTNAIMTHRAKAMDHAFVQI